MNNGAPSPPVAANIVTLNLGLSLLVRHCLRRDGGAAARCRGGRARTATLEQILPLAGSNRFSCEWKTKTKH